MVSELLTATGARRAEPIGAISVSETGGLTMSIFSRLTDIVNSNLNALLDKAEDPEKMVRLIIQEMEETLVEVRSTSARAIADRKELIRRREWLKDESSEWERKAEVAVRKEREDLARAALLEKNRILESVEALERELAGIDETLTKLGTDTEALQMKLKDAKNRQSTILMRGKAAKARLGIRRHLHESQIDDAMQRFELYERKIDGLEGQVEAYDVGRRSLADEIRELEAGEEVDEELQRLKAKVSGQQSPSDQGS
jgi:phage shock protein A